MMNSLEALENLTYCVNGMESKEKYYNTILQDLERLEKVHKAFCDLGIAYETLEFENIYLKKENEKLKQVIENIKKLPNCDICDENWHKGCMCLQKKIKEVLEDE